MTTDPAGWTFACPACRTPFRRAEGDRASCAACGRTYSRAGRVWDFLLPGDEAATAQFVTDYSLIRGSEGRSLDPPDLRQLPDTDPDDPRREEWRVRRASFEALTALLSRAAENGAAGRAWKVLDAGAGTGWLSNRLSGLGYRPLAVDLCVDGDGLAAAEAFDDGPEDLFPRARATFERLPVAENQADWVVFNASLHYSADTRRALVEAARCLANHGSIVITDSPFYRKHDHGEMMLGDRRADFRARFGTESSAHGGPEFFTWAGMRRLAAELGFEWSARLPWRGVRFELRPLSAALHRRRPPATFPMVVLCLRS